MTDMPFHEAAGIFPLAGGSELDELARDIKENGLELPIETFNGEIIDGRRRYLACQKVGVEPDIVEVEPADPVAYVVSLNLHRRHLDEGERGMVAARIESQFKPAAKERQKTSTGGKRPQLRADSPRAEPRARDQAAAAVGASGRTTADAKRVITKGSKELIAAVDGRTVAVSVAAKLAGLSKGEQARIVKAGKKAIKKALAPPPPRYIAVEQLRNLLNDLNGRIGFMERDYGSLTAMVRSKKWNPKETRSFADWFKVTTEAMVKLNTEMQKLCPK